MNFRSQIKPKNPHKVKTLLWSIVAVFFPLLILILYTAFFLIRWSDFVQDSGGIDDLRELYKQGKGQSGRAGSTIKRDKDQIAAEKILSEAFRKRFDKQIDQKEHYIMEDSYFDRYPQAYYTENSDKNFIRLTKNISFYNSQDFEKIVPEYKKRLASQTNPLIRFRFLLDLAFNYALYDDAKQSFHYIDLALRQIVAPNHLRDAWYLKASLHYQAKDYKKAAQALANCTETVFFETELLSFLVDFQLVERQNLAAYLSLDERLVQMINRLDGDLYYLQYVYDELEIARRKTTDPMALFFAAEVLYGAGNLKKAKLYFKEYHVSEKRANFSSFKKVAADMENILVIR